MVKNQDIFRDPVPQRLARWSLGREVWAQDLAGPLSYMVIGSTLYSHGAASLT